MRDVGEMTVLSFLGYMVGMYYINKFLDYMQFESMIYDVMSSVLEFSGIDLESPKEESLLDAAGVQYGIIDSVDVPVGTEPVTNAELEAFKKKIKTAVNTQDTRKRNLSLWERTKLQLGIRNLLKNLKLQDARIVKELGGLKEAAEYLRDTLKTGLSPAEIHAFLTVVLQTIQTIWPIMESIEDEYTDALMKSNNIGREKARTRVLKDLTKKNHINTQDLVQNMENLEILLAIANKSK